MATSASTQVREGWQELPLIECTSDRQISYGVVQPGFPVTDGVPIVRVNNLVNGRIITHDAMRIAPEIDYTHRRTKLRGGEIVISLVGTTGSVAIVPDELTGWNVARAIAVIRPDEKIGASWLKLCLESSQTREYLDARANTTVQKTLNLKDVKLLPIPLPPPHWRQEILSLISPIENAINNLVDENRSLESVAQTIFKSWFVDFDPVRAKAEGREPEGIDADTAALFPDGFQDSELGEIPYGWSVSTIKELACNIQYGFTTSAKAEVIGPKFLRITDIQGGQVNWSKVPYCIASEAEYDRYRLRPHDIVVARTGASTGENIYLPVVPDAVFASYLVRFQFDHPAVARLVGAFMRTTAYCDFVQNSIGGSAQPNASAQVLAGAKLVLPTPVLLRQFAEIVEQLDEKLWHNVAQSITLADVRDTLLPRLISGKLRVPKAEAMLTAV